MEKWWKMNIRKLSLQFKDNTRDSFTPTWDPVSGFFAKDTKVPSCHRRKKEILRYGTS